MHIRICPNSLKRLKHSEDDDGVNQIGTVRQPAQWNPESSRQEFIHQTLQQKQTKKIVFQCNIERYARYDHKNHLKSLAR